MSDCSIQKIPVAYVQNLTMSTAVNGAEYQNEVRSTQSRLRAHTHTHTHTHTPHHMAPCSIKCRVYKRIGTEFVLLTIIFPSNLIQSISSIET